METTSPATSASNTRNVGRTEYVMGETTSGLKDVHKGMVVFLNR